VLRTVASPAAARRPGVPGYARRPARRTSARSSGSVAAQPDTGAGRRAGGRGQQEVQQDGHVLINGSKYQVGTGLAGATVTIRLDGHLMHATADSALAGTWPCRSPPSRPPGSPVPGPRPPCCPHRRCPQGPTLPGGGCTSAAGSWSTGSRSSSAPPRREARYRCLEDTCYRILRNGEELAIKPRRDTTTITGSTFAARTPSRADG
jgi:hypothetical protein